MNWVGELRRQSFSRQSLQPLLAAYLCSSRRLISVRWCEDFIKAHEAAGLTRSVLHARCPQRPLDGGASSPGMHSTTRRIRPLLAVHHRRGSMCMRCLDQWATQNTRAEVLQLQESVLRLAMIRGRPLLSRTSARLLRKSRSRSY